MLTSDIRLDGRLLRSVTVSAATILKPLRQVMRGEFLMSRVSLQLWVIFHVHNSLVKFA